VKERRHAPRTERLVRRLNGRKGVEAVKRSCIPKRIRSTKPTTSIAIM
jgi:hypothetical protein